MDSNNQKINNLGQIKKITEEIKYINSQISNFINLTNYFRKLLSDKKDNLNKLCSHNSKIKKRENGLYGEIYWYCPDCELEF